MHELNVTSLAVMHDGYRLSVEAMCQLVDGVSAGSVFDLPTLQSHDSQKSRLVAVTRFEDGRLALRDGLHRATAIMLARPAQALFPYEYHIEEMTYEMFLQPNLSVGFFTPFDPRIEVRVADWSDFRSEVARISTTGDPTPYITSRRQDYTRPRQPYHDALSLFYAHCSPYAGVPL